MTRWCRAAAMIALLPVLPATAGEIEDWIGWSVERQPEELEDLLGVDVGTGVSADALAWWLGGGGGPGEAGALRVRRRPGVELTAGLRLEAWGGARSGAGVQLTIGMRTAPRYGVARRPVVGRTRGPRLPARTGVARLDGVLWELARLEDRDRFGVPAAGDGR